MTHDVSEWEIDRLIEAGEYKIHLLEEHLRTLKAAVACARDKSISAVKRRFLMRAAIDNIPDMEEIA